MTAWVAARHSPAPWALRFGINRLAPCVVAELRWQAFVTTEDAAHVVTRTETTANGHLILAAPELLEAAQLTALYFTRKRNIGIFQGDDEHAAWRALRRAIALAAPPWTLST